VAWPKSYVSAVPPPSGAPALSLPPQGGPGLRRWQRPLPAAWVSGVAVQRKALFATIHSAPISNRYFGPCPQVAEVGLAVAAGRPTQRRTPARCQPPPANRPPVLGHDPRSGTMSSAFTAAWLIPRMGSSLQDERHLHGHPIFIDLSIFYARLLLDHVKTGNPTQCLGCAS